MTKAARKVKRIFAAKDLPTQLQYILDAGDEASIIFVKKFPNSFNYSKSVSTRTAHDERQPTTKDNRLEKANDKLMYDDSRSHDHAHILHAHF
jgi:hypothetical protein